MKNIITVISLLAAGTALANAGIVTATTSTKDNQGTYYGFTLALGTDSSALTYSDDIIKSVSGEVSLDTLKITARTGSGGASSTKVAVYSYTSDGNVGSFVGLSDSQSFVDGQEITFTFNGASLTLDSRYQFLFVKDEATADILKNDTALFDTYKTYAQSFGTAVTANNYAGTLPSGWGTYKNDTLNKWEGHRMPVLTISVSSAAIPEPSAFGLLAGVGALALVATRRRRRAK